ncbi:TolC family protein [Pelagicoccus sp. SDUM812003]|uniref:TolC family protein n=1 Tax=Pelagicoccus sp. SDUM812003 TaxID=3041267 RepID=UPI00280E38CE|nr:TolC family protein [Pelagicoccus sp. SDUM812003]MDQ8205597.1 TolC family protein [Pelagicoccus sp. SDUM812003]
MISIAAAPAQTQSGDFAEAIQATLANHPAIIGKQAEAEAGDFAVREARSQRLPSLSAQASRYVDDDRSVLTNDDLSTPVTLRLRQPLYAFGRIGDSIDLAEAGSRREQADLFRVRRELIQETALAYLAVLSARERVSVAQANLDQLAELRAQIQRRAEGELASDADIRLAATRVAQGRIQLERFRGELEIALSDLHSLTREAVDAQDDVPSALTELPSDIELRQSILNQSADLQLREKRIEEVSAETKRIRSSARPTLYLQAERYHDQPGLRDDSQVSIVFDTNLEGMGFVNRHRAGASSARQIAAEQDLAATRVDLLRQFHRLRANRELQGDLMTLQSASVADMEALLDSYRRQYESGSKSWLDVLNIQRELNENRLQQAQTENDWLAQTLKLQALSGGLDDLVGLESPQ